MTRPIRGQSLEQILGYQFSNPSLGEQALTPPSTGLPVHNQRLEFLGDAILNACTALLVYREHPDWDEGSLSKLRGHLVGTESLYEWARDLGFVLITGPRTPTKGITGAALRKALADAMEALLASVFLDAGAQGDGMNAAFVLVEKRHLATIRNANPTDWLDRDFKTALQERAAALGLPPPVYSLVDKRGPEHAPSFSMTVRVGIHSGSATASTRKAAEALAAKQVLPLLEKGTSPSMAP